MKEAARKKRTSLLAEDRKSSPGKGILSREADDQRLSGDMAEPEETGEKKAVAEGHLDVTTKELKSDELKVLAKAKK